MLFFFLILVAILKIEIPKFLNKIQPMDCQQQQLNNNQ